MDQTESPNAAHFTKMANVPQLDLPTNIPNLNKKSIEEIIREGEEIDESIERLEQSLKKLKDQEQRAKSQSSKVPKLNFKKLKGVYKKGYKHAAGNKFAKMK